MSLFESNVNALITEEAYLIGEFRRGETRALKQIFMKYHASICYFAGDFTKDFEVAKDIASETFMALWGRREDFDSIRAIKAFLYISARNACLNYLRRSKMIQDHRKISLVNASREELKDDVVMGRIFDAEVLREIHSSIETLPTQCKRVLKLTLEGIRTEEIADMMGLSPQTVRNTRVRATVLLKKRLADNGVELAILVMLFHGFGSHLFLLN